jgi:hypothetical protein
VGEESPAADVVGHFHEPSEYVLEQASTEPPPFAVNGLSANQRGVMVAEEVPVGSSGVEEGADSADSTP